MGNNTELYTVKDLAKRWSISYESTRAFIERHKAEIGEHILQPQKGRLRHYDAVALEILEKYRSERPVIVKVDNKIAEIDKLQKDVEDLKRQLDNMRILYEQSQAHLVTSQERVIQAQEQTLQIQSQYHALLTAKEQDAEQVRQEIETEIRTSARAEVGQEIQKLEDQHEKDLQTIQSLKKELEVMRQHTSTPERTRSPLQALFRRKR